MTVEVVDAVALEAVVVVVVAAPVVAAAAAAAAAVVISVRPAEWCSLFNATACKSIIGTFSKK